MKPWLSVLAGFLGGIIAAAIIFIIAAQPRGTALPLPVQPTLTQVKIYITGEVKHPGLYTLSREARVNDAINLAGGFTTNAATENINLASYIKDGDKIHVPTLGDKSVAFESEKSANLTTTYPININTATREELITLPGIGETKADAIIEYRTRHGNFATIEDIQDVTGIGTSIYDQIKNLIIAH